MSRGNSWHRPRGGQGPGAKPRSSSCHGHQPTHLPHHPEPRSSGHRARPLAPWAGRTIPWQDGPLPEATSTRPSRDGAAKQTQSVRSQQLTLRPRGALRPGLAAQPDSPGFFLLSLQLLPAGCLPASHQYPLPPGVPGLERLPERPPRESGTASLAASRLPPCLRMDSGRPPASECRPEQTELRAARLPPLALICFPSALPDSFVQVSVAARTARWDGLVLALPPVGSETLGDPTALLTVTPSL